MKLASLRAKGVKTNLMSLCDKYKIDFDPSKLHDALYDIEKNFEVFKKLIWSHDI
jgi:DNA polymerase III epsilon subunit-like protein